MVGPIEPDNGRAERWLVPYALRLTMDVLQEGDG